MASVPRVGDLDIDQDLRFQRREWRFERIAWGVMILIVLAAIAGLLGSGPLSDRTTSSPDGLLEIDHERFLNHGNPTTLTLRLAGELTPGDTVRVAINRTYFDAVDLHRIIPEPVVSEAGEDRIVFVFRVADPGRPVRIIFHLESTKQTSLRGEVAVGGSVATFRQTVYP